MHRKINPLIIKITDRNTEVGEALDAVREFGVLQQSLTKDYLRYGQLFADAQEWLCERVFVRDIAKEVKLAVLPLINLDVELTATLIDRSPDADIARAAVRKLVSQDSTLNNAGDATPTILKHLAALGCHDAFEAVITGLLRDNMESSCVATMDAILEAAMLGTKGNNFHAYTKWIIDNSRTILERPWAKDMAKRRPFNLAMDYFKHGMLELGEFIAREAIQNARGSDLIHRLEIIDIEVTEQEALHIGSKCVSGAVEALIKYTLLVPELAYDPAAIKIDSSVNSVKSVINACLKSMAQVDDDRVLSIYKSMVSATTEQGPVILKAHYLADDSRNDAHAIELLNFAIACEGAGAQSIDKMVRLCTGAQINVDCVLRANRSRLEDLMAEDIGQSSLVGFLINPDIIRCVSKEHHMTAVQKFAEVADNAYLKQLAANLPRDRSIKIERIRKMAMEVDFGL